MLHWLKKQEVGELEEQEKESVECYLKRCK